MDDEQGWGDLDGGGDPHQDTVCPRCPLGHDDQVDDAEQEQEQADLPEAENVRDRRERQREEGQPQDQQRLRPRAVETTSDGTCADPDDRSEARAGQGPV